MAKGNKYAVVCGELLPLTAVCAGMTLSKADLKADFDSAVLARDAATTKQTNEGQCLRKKPYMTKTAAVTTAAKCWEKRQVQLRTYQCPNCSWWHLTKLGVAQ